MRLIVNAVPENQKYKPKGHMSDDQGVTPCNLM